MTKNGVFMSTLRIEEKNGVGLTEATAPAKAGTYPPKLMCVSWDIYYELLSKNVTITNEVHYQDSIMLRSQSKKEDWINFSRFAKLMPQIIASI